MGASASLNGVDVRHLEDAAVQLSFIDALCQSNRVDRLCVMKHTSAMHGEFVTYATFAGFLCSEYLSRSASRCDDRVNQRRLTSIVALLKRGANVNKIHLVDGSTDGITRVDYAYGGFCFSTFVAGSSPEYDRYVKLMRVLIHYGYSMTQFFKDSRHYVRDHKIAQSDVERFARGVLKRHVRAKLRGRRGNSRALASSHHAPA